MAKSARGYEPLKVFYRTLEPVHIGSGGYRLGRVDNSICREPGTNLPKIPGTSLAGAARAYAAMALGKPQAAGQQRGMKPEDRVNCPILFVFGSAADNDTGQAGKVAFGDAHIVFFPVATMRGPVWVTTPQLLKRYFEYSLELATGHRILATKGVIDKAGDKLNLGWLLFSESEVTDELPLTPAVAEDCVKRLAVVHESVFPQIVNGNLEVRTSVAISPETGAAEPGALFTYEAIPRDCILVHEVVENCFADPPKGVLTDTPLDLALKGLRLIDPLGVGGMGNRGFGRMKMIHPKEKGK
jgi:CRISPR-associated protein Cmr4